MRRASKPIAIAGVVTLAMSLVSVVVAQDGPLAVRSARGGELVTTPRHQFEVFFYRTGLRVFPRGAAGAPVDVTNVAGTVTFTIPGAPQPFVYQLKGGRQPESLDLVVDLSKVPATGSTVAFDITGLADPAEGRVSFTVPFTLVPSANLPQPSPAQGSAPTSPSPRYTYGPGYYGYGYYQEYENVGPNTGYSSRNDYGAPTRRAAPAARSQIPVDWSTGRQNPLAKPWMRPQD
jgi:hypothetical protein